ncbi:MAG: ATP synthase gamma chain [candidate division WS6 bacterium GW2011_GWA2_37_6]|uniref:ATP synthase gamma chain n=1 Tax=candidate division WS6 bacterium GW2011_GWA2_37_6 TaxID=1619087 RepID=A0A0G0JD39_9BACT|nr:MAG: ATP synthase gamma chain [candidate division WS6 bacterium GW2011_GWA2_37_6]
MATTREIKRRIKSIDSTAQITKALQMMSASKMAKAQQVASESVPYAEGLYEIVNLIGDVKGYKSPYIREIAKVEKAVIVLVGPTRGFVGTQVSALAYDAKIYLDEFKRKNTGVEISAICVNSLGLKLAKLLGIDVRLSFLDIAELPGVYDLEALIKVLREGFEAGEFDEVHIAYTHFVNTIIQKPVIKKLLPIKFEELAKQLQEKEIKKETNFLFEPGRDKVLDKLLPEYFEMQVLSALLESKASEESARMIAMKNATDNAIELRDKLFLKYNRTRQSKITAEIIDIVSGSLNSQNG